MFQPGKEPSGYFDPSEIVLNQPIQQSGPVFNAFSGEPCSTHEGHLPLPSMDDDDHQHMGTIIPGYSPILTNSQGEPILVAPSLDDFHEPPAQRTTNRQQQQASAQPDIGEYLPLMSIDDL
jgi:hypothetical protein